MVPAHIQFGRRQARHKAAVHGGRPCGQQKGGHPAPRPNRKTASAPASTSQRPTMAAPRRVAWNVMWRPPCSNGIAPCKTAKARLAPAPESQRTRGAGPGTPARIEGAEKPQNVFFLQNILRGKTFSGCAAGRLQFARLAQGAYLQHGGHGFSVCNFARKHHAARCFQRQGEQAEKFVFIQMLAHRG